MLARTVQHTSTLDQARDRNPEPCPPDLLPRMAQVLRANLAQAGSARTLPYLVMFITSNAGGWAGDYLITSRRASVAGARKAVNSVGALPACCGGLGSGLIDTCAGAHHGTGLSVMRAVGRAQPGRRLQTVSHDAAVAADAACAPRGRELGTDHQSGLRRWTRQYVRNVLRQSRLASPVGVLGCGGRGGARGRRARRAGRMAAARWHLA